MTKKKERAHIKYNKGEWSIRLPKWIRNRIRERKRRDVELSLEYSAACLFQLIRAALIIAVIIYLITQLIKYYG